MKTSTFLALFGFILAVGFSVAVTENELANIADKAEKLRGEEYMTESDGEFDKEDLEGDDKAISLRNDMVTEEEEFNEGVLDNDDDRDKASDDVTAMEKSADPFRFRRRFRRRARPRRRVWPRRRPRRRPIGIRRRRFRG